MKKKTSTRTPKAAVRPKKRQAFRKVPERLLAEDHLTPDQLKLCEAFEYCTLCEPGDAVRIVLGEMPQIIRELGMDANHFDPAALFELLRGLVDEWKRQVLIYWLKNNLREGLNRIDPPPTNEDFANLRHGLPEGHRMIGTVMLAVVLAMLRCRPVPGVPMSSATYGRDHVCLQ